MFWKGRNWSLFCPPACTCWKCNEGQPSVQDALLDRGREEDKERAQYELGDMGPWPEPFEPVPVVEVKAVDPEVAPDPDPDFPPFPPLVLPRVPIERGARAGAVIGGALFLVLAVLLLIYVLGS